MADSVGSAYEPVARPRRPPTPRRRPPPRSGPASDPAPDEGALNPPGTRRGAPTVGVAGPEGAGPVPAPRPASAPGAGSRSGTRGGGGAARVSTRAWGSNGAQAAQTSLRVHTWPTAGSCRRTRTTEPAQATRVPSCSSHRWRRHQQAASWCTAAALACAAAWATAKRRRAAMSRERGGITHGEEQVTDAVRSRCPTTRIVQQRPGRRADGASGYIRAKAHVLRGGGR